MKLARNCRWILAAGLAVVFTGAVRAQDSSLAIGQQRTYRWNDQRTGYGFYPGSNGGTEANQMPATTTSVRDTTTNQDVAVPNPDLTWIYPLDLEGRPPDDPGNLYPQGYRLGEIHSSPTVASLDIGGLPILSVMFGSGTSVRRDLRNELPGPNGTAGRPSKYVDPDTGLYDSSRDPYAYLNGQNTGAVFALEAFAGTREEFDAGSFTRNYRPLWWYGVRILPYYTAADNDITPSGQPGDVTFAEAPYEAMSRFYANASDTAMRAFDYGPNEALDANNFLPLPDTSAGAAQNTRRLQLLSQYIAPSLDATRLSNNGKDTGPGYDSGAGVVAKGRPDIPERLTDRLYNLNITGARFGISSNRTFLMSGGAGNGRPNEGPLNNRFRLTSGMGEVQSTGVFVRLPDADAVTYTSEYYRIQADGTDGQAAALNDFRRDPRNIQRDSNLTTNHLYIVGSDDGYVYAFDANPENARQVGPSTSVLSTNMGRLVWAFRAAVRPPLYVDRDGNPLTISKFAAGEQATALDGQTHVITGDDDSALVTTQNTPIISGGITSSPVAARITLPGTAFNFAGQTRTVVFIGSAIGRLFCLDAATGQEIWEFKTTPRDYTLVRKGSNFYSVDGVTGYPVTTSPTLGWLPAATSQLRPGTPGRLGLFFGADDGKVYALDAADGSPLTGWNVDAQRVSGSRRTSMTDLTAGTRGLVDHYGFVTYSFEDTSGNPLSTTAIDGKFGRRRSDLAQPVTASVVARPAGNGVGYTEPDTGRLIPEVNLLFVSSTTNQRDASVGENPGFTGGSIFGVDPNDGSVDWTFDRWSNPARATNGQFDTDTSKDQYVRPGGFAVTPAYATQIHIYNEAGTGNNGADGETNPLENQNVLFAIDASGRLFALDGDTGSATNTVTKTSEDRLFWKVPYSLPGSVGQGNGVYSSPVVSTPITEGDPQASYSGRSYVFVGVSGGIVAVDTVAMRAGLVTGPNNQPLTSGQYTGGEVTWGWETPRDSVSVDNSLDPPVAVITSSAKPVVTTPAIYTGYVYAGSDNGFLYAWSNQIANFGFGNGGGNGYGRFRGGRPRPPIPQNQRPSGGNRAPVNTTFYADVFQAGLQQRQYGATKFTTPDAIDAIRPVGVPPASNTSGDTTTPVTPAPVGIGEPDFVNNGGTGILEWGDPVVVVAWGEALDKIVLDQGGVVDPDKLGTVTLKLTGSGVNASLRANIEFENGHAYARQIFYLNPFTTTTPASLRYLKAPPSEVGNPLFGAPLTPGSSVFTVSAEYNGPRITTTDPDGKQQTRPGTRFTSTPASTKFRVANPLNITGRFEKGQAPRLLVPVRANPYEVEDARRNGNEFVPVITSIVGDHGTPTKANADSTMQVMDRSNLGALRALANGRAAGSGNDIYLRVRVDAATLRWTGGPQAAYKPLLARTNAVPNGIPLQDPLTPPEPLFTTYWGPQLSSIYDVSLSNAYIGAEQPPARMGEQNNSRDYPDIQPTTETWKMRAQPPYTRADIDATNSDAGLFPSGVADVDGSNVSSISAGLLYLQASIPKYQPANYSPAGRDPSNGVGFGPGYYTINPTNSTAMRGALLGWNRNGSASGAGSYFAFNRPDANGGNVQQYAGPFGTLLPASPTLAAQERGYLTKVYVDLNGNGNADTGAEPYRMFVSGVQVRPDERLNVTAATVEVPQGPEKDIPGGYIPFQFYYDRQAVAAGAGAGDEDAFLFGERNFFAPFTVYNQGNVNLWSVRMAKYDPGASHLVAPGVDTNPYVGASALSNWPASGILKRTNLVSTLDALPKAPGSGAGASTDSSLWTPAPKPRVGISDEGQGQIMQVKDVFAFLPVNGLPSPKRAHNASGIANPPGRPYLSVAVPPGTPPGKYVTGGPLVLFEDSGPPYNNSVPAYNGVLDLDVNGNPMETGVPGDAQVLVTVGESRLTDKVSRLAPNIPQVDAGVAFAATYAGGVPNSQAELTRIWQTLAQDATPSAYRDPRTGDLVTFWSSNRVGTLTDTNGFQPLPGLTPGNQVADRYHIFASAMTWQDPLNPPISPNADVSQFLTGVLAKNPWGWQYQGGNRGNFFFPNFGEARWFGPPSVQTWIPDAATVNGALGLPTGANAPDLTYTSPAPITDFHGTQFPPVVFWTGSTGTGAGARSAIFYAPVTVDRATGTVGTSAGIQAVGVTGGQRTLDPFVPKFAPQPFLITTGGMQTASGPMSATSYLQNEQVTGLGLVWFGGAPGAWKLYVSTIATDANGNPTGDGQWKTDQLDLPDGISSAMYPSAYYAQDPAPTNSGGDRQGIVNIAFSGYTSSGRNPDIYVARYRAAQGGPNWAGAKIGDFRMLSFKRQGGITGAGNTQPTVTLEQLERVPNEPRPIYRSHWAQWMGRRGNGVTVYWFKKPVAAPGTPGRIDDYQLYATFTSGSPGGSRNTNVREISGRLAQGGGTLPGVTAFIDAGAGTVRFATTDPVHNPAPLSRPYGPANAQLQDFIFLAATPSVLRVTTDDDVMDTQPRIWLDQTHEAITDPGRTNMPVSPANPLVIRRDRMWVVWRRSAQPEGVTRASGLFYQTFRVGIDLGGPIPVDRNGRALVEVKTIDGQDIATEVDPDKGRIYFSTDLDGSVVNTAVNNGQPGRFVVGWLPENTSAPTPAGSGSGFYLPLSHWPAPRVVPTSQQGNDSQPWIFKDPFSDLAPGTPEYYARGNNDMWLFWSSTRPSQSIGAVKASPTLGGPGSTGGPDPYYFTQSGLMFTSSASDVYYTTISPDFAKR